MQSHTKTEEESVQFKQIDSRKNMSLTRGGPGIK